MHAPSGRPREFTHPKRRELIDHIGQGATVEEAARIVGVSLRTVQREAKHNEFFHHDLHLALHAGPVDPYKLMLRAARTHWRAAAWLLERTDPDHFAKRPPNSCRPETLMEVSAWLIETALEATAPEQREAVYRRMHAVADKAFDVLMPDQHDARRSLVGALPERAMPLSDHEIAKILRSVQDDPALDLAAQSAPAPTNPGAHPRTHIENFRLFDSEVMDADGRYPLPNEEDDADFAAATPPTVGGVSDADSAHHNSRESGSIDRGRRPLPHDAAGASADPPNRGIMSPKMHSATEVAATKLTATESDETGGDVTQCQPSEVPPDPAPLHAANGIVRHQAGDGIAGRKVA